MTPAKKRTSPSRSKRKRFDWPHGFAATIHFFQRSRIARIALAVILLVPLGWAVAERLMWNGRVFSGVEIEGLEIANKSEADVAKLITARAKTLETDLITARAGSIELTLDPTLIRLDVDEEGTLRETREAGRTGGPIAQVTGSIVRRLRPDEIQWRVSYNDEMLQGVLDSWEYLVAGGEEAGGLTFEGATVKIVEPNTGMRLDRAGSSRLMVEMIMSPFRKALVLPMGNSGIEITRADLSRLAESAEEILAEKVVVTVEGISTSLSPETVGSLLGTVIAEKKIALSIDEVALATALGAEIAALEVHPADATFAISGTSVSVVPSVPGRTVDLSAISGEILRSNHNISGQMTDLAPKRDTAWAQSLGIKEQVSTFTTKHPSGQPRVTNIHRAADILQNYIVEPGAEFSLNEAIGKRTIEAGFVKAPVYYQGFTEDVGGGVSQFATTVFNAIFFGGYEILEHKPHSVYFSRYPMGRESTVSWPKPDVRFLNNTKAGVLIRASYSSSSITITFYGDLEGKQVSAEGPNILMTYPPGQLFEDSLMVPAGKTQVLEKPYTGYDVEVFRVIKWPDGTVTRKRFFWKYRMIDEKILVGPPLDPGATTTIPPEISTTLPGETTTTAPPAPSTSSSVP